MRKVVLYQLHSLDGVAEEPGDWMFDADKAVFDNLGEIIATPCCWATGSSTPDPAGAGSAAGILDGWVPTPGPATAS